MALRSKTNCIGAQLTQKTTITTKTRRVTLLLFLWDSLATLLWKLKENRFTFFWHGKALGIQRKREKITSDQLCSEKVFQVLKKFPVLTWNRLITTHHHIFTNKFLGTKVYKMHSLNTYKTFRKWSTCTDNDRYSGHGYSGIHRYSGTKISKISVFWSSKL